MTIKTKKTIRKLRGLPSARAYYRLLRELASIEKRLANLGPAIERLEADASIVGRARQHDDGGITLQPLEFKDVAQKVGKSKGVRRGRR